MASESSPDPHPTPRHARPAPGVPRPASAADGRLDSVAASREVMAALGLGEPAAAPPAPEPDVAPVARHAAVIAPGPSTDVVFAPRVFLRRFLTLVSLGVFAAACYAGYLVHDDHTDEFRVAALVGLGVLTLVLWAIIVSSPVTHLAIRSGQLDVRRGALHQVFDLNSRYTPVQVVGKPGSPGWKVLLGRSDRPPLVIDGGMVNGREFGAALASFRPTSEAPPRP